MKYIVLLQTDREGDAQQFIAPWTGDPGRTCKIENAKRYNTISSATFGLAHARKYRDFLNAKIQEQPE